MADKLRIAKIENVQVLGGGQISTVTLHLTAHHLILVQTVTPPLQQDLSTPPPIPKTRESWIAYPMIGYCTFRPTPPGSGQASSIRLRGRDFKFLTFNFVDDKQARDAFESIKGATCRLGSIEKLYAFNYEAPPPEKKINGWEVYDAKAEWKRQGISDKGIDRGWRISKINTDYGFSPTYPALLPVPSRISDNTLNYAGRYRSRVRIPVLTYLHPVNNCSITRSSQPLAGLRGNRSIQDEKLVSACFSACTQPDEVEITSSTVSRASPASSQADLSSSGENVEFSETEKREDELISSSSTEVVGDKPHIYGAQQHNLIVDARPTVNALAMQAVGLGSENMDHYKFATKAYLGIDNIHVMRNSLDKVIEAIKDSDISKLPPNRDLLAKSGWLKHITGLLDGSALIARQVGIQHSHVLIHCSDGWDRTSQLSALSQIMLDPYFRTIDGFIVLVEKDWLAFGHMFQHRSGFLNSEKWFQTQNDALAGSAIQPGGNGESRSDAIENALLSAKRFFNKSNQSQDAIADSDGEVIAAEDSPKNKKTKDSLADKEATKPKETSPVFHQFLDATYQLLHQYPNRFEFNERFLRRLLYHLYSCQYGTFLYNNEKSRLDARLHERTASVWSYFLSRRAEFTNKDYDGGEVNDHVKGRERLLFPRLEKVRWWHEVFNRTDQDMNGPSNAATDNYLGSQDTPGANRSVLTSVETAHHVAPSGSGTKSAPESINNTPAPSSLASLRDGIAGLGIGMGKNGSGSKVPSNGKEALEVEMQ
ncbi:hypothetical protein WAI453_001124 [Rhynchosporium graminicola]